MAMPELSKETTFRINKGSLLKENGIEKAARTANIRLGGEGGIILLLDSDGQCPATLGPSLLSRLQSACGHLKITAIVAHQEYENWFTHAAQSLILRKDFSDFIEQPDDPDSIRDAKGWIARNRLDKKYSEILDQPAITSTFDLLLARSSDSFDKFFRDVSSFVASSEI